MARDEWFRRTAWSKSAAKDFFARLNRSRSGSHKAQYLRIQAHTLAESGRADSVYAALELLDNLFSEYPEPSELSAAHLLAAQCHEKLGKTTKALEHFELSLQAQTSFPNRDTGVSIEYPWFVARNNLRAHYATALETLEQAHVAFPITAFKAAATRAFIADAQRDPIAARHACAAIEAASQKQSQFRYHEQLGLVGKNYAQFIKRLRKIAAA